MAVAGTLTYDTKLDTDNYQKGLKKISGATIAIGQLMADAFKMVASKLVDVVKGGIQYNATIEQLTTSFEVMTGSTDKATALVEKLKKAGAETPYELAGLAETTQLLMQYGLTSDDAYKATMNLGDISQGSADKMQRIAMAYGQMSSAGKVSLEDVKQMIEAGFNPLQEISKTTGESMSSLYDRISKGKISVDEITASMSRSSSEGGKYYQSMEKQSKTLNGQMSTLQDNWSNLTGTITKSVTDKITNDVLPKLNDFIVKLTEKIETTNWDKVSEKIKDLGLIVTMTTSAFVAFTIAQYALNLAMSLNPIGLIVAAIAALVAGFIYLWNTNEGFREFWINLWDTISSYVQTAIDTVVGIFNTVIDFVKNNWQGILSFLLNPFVRSF